MTNQNKIINKCFYAFLISGLTVLMIGAIIPYMREERGFSYTVAGSFLSAYAIGNFSASFFSPFLASKIGRKYTIVLLSSLVPISFFVVLLSTSSTVIFCAFLAAGLGRGGISNINNAVVNDASNGSPAKINILHTFFAIGAFIAPFLTSTFIYFGLTWKHVLITTIVLSITGVIAYGTMELQDKPVKEEKKAETVSNNKYLKSVDFYIIGFLLFFYLGLENCVNGWFVSYLQDTGVMSASYATNLVSIVWICVIIGRLTCAYLSKKFSKKRIILINSIGCVSFFLLLISTTNIAVITISIIGLGLFLAGIYPTGVANAGLLIKGSTTGMAMLLAIASLGGIIMPQIIGVLADKIGMSGAIGILAIDVVIMLILAIINNVRNVIV